MDPCGTPDGIFSQLEQLPSITTINEWNSLPNDIKESVSISGFKHKVISFLVNS